MNQNVWVQDCDPRLYALVMGATIVLLREKLQLRQAELADRAGIPATTLTRIEKGANQEGANQEAFTLQKVVRALQLQDWLFSALVEEGIAYTERVARLVMPPLAQKWWPLLQSKVGQRGAEGLIAFAVATVLSERLV